MEDLIKLKVPELKERLKQLKLPLKGKKAELLARLQAAVQARASPSAPAPPQPSSLASSSSAAGSTPLNQPLPPIITSKQTQAAVDPSERPSKAALKPSVDGGVAPPLSKKARLESPRQYETNAPAASCTPSLSPSATRHVLKLDLQPTASCSANGTASSSSSLSQTIIKRSVPSIAPSSSKQPSIITLTKRTPFKSPLLASSNRSVATSSSAAQPQRPNSVPAFNPPRSLFTEPNTDDAFRFLTSSWPYRLYSSLSDANSSSLDPSALISSSLFSTTAGHPHQFAMAYRFIVSRLYLLLAHSSLADLVHSSKPLLGLPSVQNCEPVIEGIWRLSLSDGTSVYVLEATGEVLGSVEEVGKELRLGEPNPGEQERARGRSLRGDWGRYISEVKEGRGKRLHELVGGGDGEEFVGGLSERVRRAAGESDKVAEMAVKYLLAQSTPNTISGAPTTLTNEAFLSSSLLPTTSSRPHQTEPTCYLPPSHSLESLHLPSPSSSPSSSNSGSLHASTFLAQTTNAGSLICLMETGQCIGTEQEGGISAIWRDLLVSSG